MAEWRALLLLLLLVGAGGCDIRQEGDSQAAAVSADPDHRVACALRGAAQFSESCAFERSETDGHRILVIHHPDGSFRRFEQVTDGRGLIAADGADDVTITPREDKVEVTIAGDRYLLPATFRD